MERDERDDERQHQGDTRNPAGGELTREGVHRDAVTERLAVRQL